MPHLIRCRDPGRTRTTDMRTAAAARGKTLGRYGIERLAGPAEKPWKQIPARLPGNFPSPVRARASRWRQNKKPREAAFCWVPDRAAAHPE